MGYCRECAHWRASTLEPANDKVGVCQIDGKEKDDLRHACMIYNEKRVFTKTLYVGPNYKLEKKRKK